MAGSSRRWMQEHVNDPYVQRAQKEGYRCRAVYKLKEIQEKDRFLSADAVVIDLGAAPGGWSQYLGEILGPRSRIVALDILPMTPPAGVEFICGDFRDDTVLERLIDRLGGHRVDVIVSDMAPNMSGMSAVDRPRAMHLSELALDLAEKVLKPKGHLLIKVFQGEGFDKLLKTLRSQFEKVLIRKPAASRPRSPEVYLLARNYRS